MRDVIQSERTRGAATTVAAALLGALNAIPAGGPACPIPGSFIKRKSPQLALRKTAEARCGVARARSRPEPFVRQRLGGRETEMMVRVRVHRDIESVGAVPEVDPAPLVTGGAQ